MQSLSVPTATSSIPSAGQDIFIAIEKLESWKCENMTSLAAYTVQWEADKKRASYLSASLLSLEIQVVTEEGARLVPNQLWLTQASLCLIVNLWWCLWFIFFIPINNHSILIVVKFCSKDILGLSNCFASHLAAFSQHRCIVSFIWLPPAKACLSVLMVK